MYKELMQKPNEEEISWSTQVQRKRRFLTDNIGSTLACIHRCLGSFFNHLPYSSFILQFDFPHTEK